MAPPNVDVPEGRRPIPASSEGPKKTNAQIPVARMVVKPDTAPNPLRTSFPWKATSSWLSATSRTMPSSTPPRGEHGGIHVPRAHAQDVDAELSGGPDLKTRFVAPGNPKITADDRIFPWSVDGVVNNVDNEDKFNEYKEHTTPTSPSKARADSGTMPTYEFQSSQRARHARDGARRAARGRGHDEENVRLPPAALYKRRDCAKQELV